jgi:predicted protein tyrosine phosphatase
LYGSPAASAQTFPPDFETVTLTTGLTGPTTVTWAPDGRLFIAEKHGVVKVVNPGSNTASVLLDISDHVNDSVDRGLLGLTVDSDFASNGYLYLLYVNEHNPLDVDGRKTSRLTRVTVNADNTLENPTSPETVILGQYADGPCPPPDNTLDCIPADRHLLLSMHDIAEPMMGMVAPSGHHVETFIDFVQRWERAQPMVVHCWAGISRSTAAAFIACCTLAPERDEDEIAQALRAASPTATPNSRLVAVADDILGRAGRMRQAAAAIGRGAFAHEGTPFHLVIGTPPHQRKQPVG